MLSMTENMDRSKDYISYWAKGCSLTPRVSKYIDSVSNILHKDYPKLRCDCFNGIFAWDSDSFEKAMRKSISSNTVDMVLSLNPGMMIMIEAKLDVENVQQLKGEIETKIQKTKDYLVSSTSFVCCVNPSIVLFSSDNFERKKTRYRKMRSNKTDIVPMTISSLYDYLSNIN